MKSNLYPMLFGLLITIVVYSIIKATHNNPKITKIISIISFSFSAVLAVILLIILIITLV